MYASQAIPVQHGQGTPVKMPERCQRRNTAAGGNAEDEFGTWFPRNVDQAALMTVRRHRADTTTPGRFTCYAEEPVAASNFVRIVQKWRREEARMLLAWSYSALVYPAVVVLMSLTLQRPQPHPCLSKAAQNAPFAHSRAEPIFQSPVCTGRPAAAAPC